ncbi:hypothetical protein V6N12_007598 [Hibiscus sabdariffa]|uniref:Cytochrome b561 domain-containing protein n=1 Tax=Hibiscus sabdariffa TaxID=183260 RepID=A0ABR2F286_9ROSI
MQVVAGKLLFSALLIINVVPFVISSQEPAESIGSPTNNEENIPKVSGKVMFEIIVHGIILWVSMGFLVPVGILAIRMSANREESGALMSIKNFNNSFNNYHQRLGVALYGIIWVQALTAALRSCRGSKGRSAWFFGHWLLGTAVSILGVINIYTGLGALHEKTSASTKLWTIVLTAEISLIVFIYLFQDKWLQLQLQKQEPVLRREPVRPYPYRTRRYAPGINC